MRQEGRLLSRLGVITVVVLALGVSACGRKGPPLAPLSAHATTDAEKQAYAPGEHGPVPDNAAEEETPKKWFFLDFLL